MWRWFNWLIGLIDVWASGLPRWVYYPLNWFVAHGGVVYVLLLLGLVIAGQPGAIVAGSAGILFYLVREIVSWGGTSPWWDHVGDIVGPVAVGVLGMVPETRWLPLPFILGWFYMALCLTHTRSTR